MTPVAGSIEKLTIFSGVLWATSSMSMPPSVEATNAILEVARSTSGRQVEFLVDQRAFFDVEPVDHLALGAGLMGHQRRTEDARRLAADVLDRFDDLDAAGLAAAARMYLRLDHPYRAAELVGRTLGLLDRKGRDAARHRHAELPQHRLGLVFVNVHDACLEFMSGVVRPAGVYRIARSSRTMTAKGVSN